MIIEQEFTVDAPRDAVAAFFTDVQRVAGCVPGLEGVEETGPNQYSARLGVRMGPIRASFGGTLRLDPSEAPARLVQTFQNHLQTLEFEDLGDQTKLTQTMRFTTTEERDTTMQYGVEEGAKQGFARVDAVLEKIAA